jgi:outer membrane protein assembly factor BamB
MNRLLLAAALAAGWTQWGGPNRDFKPPATGLAASWPSGGPREVWSRSLGEGYSGIVVDGGTVYTHYRPVKGVLAALLERFRGTISSPETVVALDADSGRTLWEHTYDAPMPSGMQMEYGPGPHSTPLVADDLVFTVGVTGKLHALDKRTGRVAWSHDLHAEFPSRVHPRGYACSPVAYGANLVLTAGGKGAAVVAFDRRHGRLAWKNHDFEPSPSSPIVINVDGQDQLVVFHADGVAGVDPNGGPALWNHAHATDYGLNISTPVWGEGNLLFLSSAYSGGSRMLRLSQAGGRTTVKELWFTSKMRLHIGNALRIGDRVLGSSGDFGPAFLTALDVNSGQVAWQERGFARANLLYADGKLLILDEDGVLGLAAVTPSGVQVKARAEVLTDKAWTVPSLVGTRLYLRDRAGIKALDLG